MIFDDPSIHEGIACLGIEIVLPREEILALQQLIDKIESSFEHRGKELGRLVDSKQKQYGDSAGNAGKILAILYPNGVRTEQFTDALLVVRVLDKLSRIAQRGPDGKDLGGESPWQDIAGYGLLGAKMDETAK